MDALATLAELVGLPGPPGQEDFVRERLQSQVSEFGLTSATDAKGNLLVAPRPEGHQIVVTAHMDEIAMIVRGLDDYGHLAVGALGGLEPWKIGEGPVQLLTPGGPIDGVLSFGSIHTDDPASTVRQAESGALDWPQVRVLTGLAPEELEEAGVRPGTRVVVHPNRRGLTFLGDLVAGYFLDDRADLVAWLLALESFQGSPPPALFAATVSEEVGGEGALYLLHKIQPDVCIALELGPVVEDAPVELSAQPTVWADDSYSTMSASDGDLVQKVAQQLGLSVQFQALSRGGSDASCAQSHGLCARAITLGLPMANSHGYEVIHPGALDNLARLTVALVEAIAAE